LAKAAAVVLQKVT